jgi:predicted ribosomally synthesized peptide with SipW-like signal peptide
MSFTGTHSYFYDTECSSFNTIKAGVWDTQAQMLFVDTSNTYLESDLEECRLKCIRLQATGDKDIVIDKIQVEWDTDAFPYTEIESLKIDAKLFFYGSGVSSMVLDDNDFVVSPVAEEASKLRIYFNTEVEAPFTLRFFMEDGSIREVFIPLNSDEN